MSNKNNNCKGSIVDKLYDAIEKNPDMTVGEILHSIQVELKKRFIHSTDSEIYTAFETFVNLEEEADEPMEEQEFFFWVEQVSIVKQ